MKFRDVSGLVQSLRAFLLGIKRPHQLHNRFNPLLAPRTLPPPEIPRGPDQGYAGIYYYTRHALDSVKPPVVGPIALGLKQVSGSKEPAQPKGELVFPRIPTPGCTYWFDGHCYYETVPDPKPAKPCPPPKAKAAKKVCSKPATKKPPSSTTCDPCAPSSAPKEKPCDPCAPKKKC